MLQFVSAMIRLSLSMIDLDSGNIFIRRTLPRAYFGMPQLLRFSVLFMDTTW
jgi:hypothetical protein